MFIRSWLREVLLSEPLIFVGAIFEGRFLFHPVLAEDTAQVFLFVGVDAVFFALEAVIVRLAEVGDDFLAHRYGFLVRNAVEKSFDSPGDAHFDERHEVGAVSLGRNVAWIDRSHVFHFRGDILSGQMAQALGRAGAAGIEAMGKGAGHAAVVEGGRVVHSRLFLMVLYKCRHFWGIIIAYGDYFLLKVLSKWLLQLGAMLKDPCIFDMLTFTDLYNDTGFMPEYIGKLNFYCSAVDIILCCEGDNRTIGLLLCKTKDRIKAEYALRDIQKPIGISDYELGQSLPKDFRGSLPTIEEIEKELEMK